MTSVIEGHPVSYVNDPRIIAQQESFISINSTLVIDLTGQCNSEHLGGYHYSGAGGQVDFVCGAYASCEGKSIMVLHFDGRRWRGITYRGPASRPGNDFANG